MASGQRGRTFLVFRQRLVAPCPARWAALVLALLGSVSRRVAAQEGADPHAVMPERPTVATHAWTVAPGYAEVEVGIEWDHNPSGTTALETPTLLKIGLARRLQLGLAASLTRPPASGLGVSDLTVGLKVRLANDLPIVGALAVLPSVKLPTANPAHGTGTTDGTLLLISSHQLGHMSLDINFGYTRRSGDGARAPRSATLWTSSAGVPLAGAVGLAVEVYGYPRTGGPAGSAGIVALLAGPTLSLRPRWTADLGGILPLRGPQPDALYTGFVYNLGAL